MRKKAYRYTKDDYVFVYQMLVLRSQGWSYPKIGQMFNKDHSTVIHWCRRFNVDVGRHVLSPEDFDNHINKRPVIVTYKYQHLLEEPINYGKRTYAEYLREHNARHLNK
jgi:hypothetical protein